MNIVVLFLLCVSAKSFAENAEWQFPVVKMQGSINDTKAAGVSARIAGGTVATAGQFPWQVHVQASTNAGSWWQCGGALIHVEWVVTAAECIPGADNFVLRLGSTSRLAGGVVMTSTVSKIHPQYMSPVPTNNNIGLIKLPKAVTPTNNIKVIAIMPPTMSYGSSLTVAGWGKTCTTCNTYPTELNWSQVSTYINAQCALFYNPQMITDNNLCTVGAPTNAPCIGDLGSPIVMATPVANLYYLVGLVSFTHPGGCSMCAPAGYTKVLNYCPWLKTHITSGLTNCK